MSLAQKAGAIAQAIATLGFTGLLAKAGVGSTKGLGAEALGTFGQGSP